ncbi:MAG: hypothetical protein HOV80_39620 [Polyangiaceae bacterium]|nr:hypothetical protein [Polyangiaceae bacterium]
MTAPRRLLEDPASLRALLGDGAMSGGADIGKTLLESGLVDSSSGKAWGDGGPPAALKAEMWSSIEAALPLVGAAAAAGAASSGAASAGSAAGGTAASSAAAAGSAAVGGAAAGSTAAAAGAGATAIGATAAAPVVGLTFVTKIGLASIFIGGSLATAGVVRQQMNEEPAPPAIVAPADPASFTSGDGSQRLPALYDTMGNGSGGAGSGVVAAGTTGDASRSASDGSAASTERAGAEKRSDDTNERAHASKKDDKPRGSSEKSGDSSSSASKLVEEAAGVQQARQALAQGNASRALSILGQLDKDIPRGGLGQERAILTIEALAASGQKGQAAQLANAFLAANPSSPYADRARRHTQ